MAQTVKRLPTMRETWVQSLGQEDLLEKEMATHSSILAWKIPWMVEPSRLQSMVAKSRTQLSNFTFTFICIHKIHMYTCVLSHFTCVQLFMTLQTVALRTPLSMGFSRQESVCIQWNMWYVKEYYSAIKIMK